MCGRFVRTSSPRRVATEFGVDRVDESVDADAEPDYNVAPRQGVLVVRERRVESRRERVLSSLRWGLVPSWADDARVGDRHVNARAESLTRSPTFAESFRKRRCIVVADGFYEWQRGESKGQKQPVYFAPADARPLALAGLWSVWRDPRVTDGDPWLRTCVIVTTEANDTVAPVHHRMPVILPPGAWAHWLDPTPAAARDVHALLEPAPTEWLSSVPVSTAVNRATSNGPELLRPVVAPPRLGIA